MQGALLDTYRSVAASSIAITNRCALDHIGSRRSESAQIFVLTAPLRPLRCVSVTRDASKSCTVQRRSSYECLASSRLETVISFRATARSAVAVRRAVRSMQHAVALRVCAPRVRGAAWHERAPGTAGWLSVLGALSLLAARQKRCCGACCWRCCACWRVCVRLRCVRARCCVRLVLA